MSNETLRLLIDTNVWLDNYITSRPGHQDAASFLAHARSRGMQLLYPVESLKDAFYIANAHFKAQIRAMGREVGPMEANVARDFAWDCINNMRDISCAVGTDEADVWLAAKYRALNEDLEDNLVLAAANRAKADCLITNDTQLIAKSPVPALTPRDWLAIQ